MPRVAINQLNGLVETIAAPPHSGRAELADLAKSHILEVDDLFPIAEALHTLEFAELGDGNLRLTAAGRVLAQSGTEQRKRLFVNI